MLENSNLEHVSEQLKHKSKYKKVSYYTPESILERESKDIILSNILLTWAGCYIKAKGHIVNNRLLKDYVIVYCIDGQGWLELEHKRYSIKSGDLFVCPPGIIHSYGADEKEPWTKYWIHFRGNNADAFASLLGVTAASPVIYIGENMKLQSFFQDVLHVLKAGYTNSNLILATAYLISICSYINHQRINNRLTKKNDINIDKVINYMIDNLNTNLNLEQLSKYTNMSRYHFSKLFKEKTGYSPIDYYIRLKMQKACELLELSSIKIVNISEALGYNNQYYFSNTFKRIIGKSPQDYRKLHLK
ncbi:AraC family transcriptional regulator [Clostridium sp. SYSU_GA19001]|uniref:AraC family transcriptional regulator n=1 Tax=Clostridium caldaquaticum TaxID=2940653 RepID=UPI002076F575|nr:AraC family transcriptional regulator [Clostridium caldaquaticum]MCM8710047.1 AraC family transcriptional regulator [Clostridium caldaquaticum]